ncbi:MAG TPA: alpha-E domain-containing protein [Acidimicrobiales bacterium]|nr:alpha-E domain-containing protein [Acidimicrobiales bacterium]
MLSRIAESLFWVGRYTERAEQTARILDVQFHRLLEDPWIDESAACAGLLRAMGSPAIADGTPLNALEVCEVLAYAPSNPSSIVRALSAARDNARGAREAISGEMWECLNATWYALETQVRAARALGPHEFFRFVKERVAVLNGLAGTTLSRDDGWRFLVLGESLERADMTARLLSALWSDSGASPAWVTTLRCCSAHEAYLRTYRRAVDASLVAEFLLLDRLFPRSVVHALSTAEACLAELDPGSNRAGPGNDARRALGRARTELEFRRVDELLEDLPEQLSRLQAACSDAATAVAARYFRHTAPIEWSA